MLFRPCRICRSRAPSAGLTSPYCQRPQAQGSRPMVVVPKSHTHPVRQYSMIRANALTLRGGQRGLADQPVSTGSEKGPWSSRWWTIGLEPLDTVCWFRPPACFLPCSPVAYRRPAVGPRADCLARRRESCSSVRRRPTREFEEAESPKCRRPVERILALPFSRLTNRRGETPIGRISPQGHGIGGRPGGRD